MFTYKAKTVPILKIYLIFALDALGTLIYQGDIGIYSNLQSEKMLDKVF